MVYCKQLRCIFNENPSRDLDSEMHWNCVILTFNSLKEYDKTKCIIDSKKCSYWKPKDSSYYRNRKEDEPMDWRYHYYGSLMIYDHKSKEWIYTIKNDDRI